MSQIRLLILSLCFCFSVSVAFGQKWQLNGSLQNTEQEPLPFATAVLLQANDSVMVQYALTDESGGFSFKGLPSGKYILQFTSMGYEQLNHAFQLEADLKMDSLRMEKKDQMLEAVEVAAEAPPIAIKGDTIEYNAGSFQTQANAAVEDLLKRLPGVEVDRDGTVKAQGEEVVRVLVDGKEFFGDDPKMATKNLPADAIDKVQVYDKGSEMAEFTGVDDGERQKTINLKLKEDRKKGYFGKAKVGYGSEDRYTGKFNLNRFNKKTQFSALGMANNINEQGFSFNDYVNFMGGLNNMMSSGGGMGLGGGNGSSGLTRTIAGGTNLNYRPRKGSEIYGSYFLNQTNNDLRQSNIRTYVNDTETFDGDGMDRDESASTGHRANFTFKQQVDSLQEIRLTGNINLNASNNSSYNEQNTYSTENLLQNSSSSQNSDVGDQYRFGGDLVYRRRFRKKGRSFSASLRTSIDNSLNRTQLRSFNRFPDTLSGFTIDSIQQVQNQDGERLDYSSGLSFTEPLRDQLYLELSHSYQRQHTSSNKEFFDIAPSNMGEIFNPQLSSAYSTTFQFHRPTASLRLVKKKYNAVASLSLQQSSLTGDLISLDTSISQSFANLLPAFNMRYNFSRSSRISLRYDARVSEPQINQLQPVVDNNDPLNLYLGNPDLKPERSHDLNLSYFSHSQFSLVSFFLMLRGSFTEDKIVNGVSISDALVRTTQPTNAGRDWRISQSGEFSAPVRPLGMKFSMSGNSTFNRGILPVNGTQNSTDRWTNGAGFSVENRKKQVIDLQVGARMSLNFTSYSENSELDQSFLQSNYYTDLLVNLGETWALSTSFDYILYSGEAFASGQNIPLWQAQLSKLFLRNDKGQLKLTVFDLLNQNRGFTRNSALNYVEELRSNALGRYLMLSFTYSLTALGSRSKDQIILQGDER